MHHPAFEKTRHPLARRNRAGSMALTWLAVVILIFGSLVFAGGVWLIVLRGSWYYGLAGAGLLATAYGLFRGAMWAVWVYLLTFGFTVAWAVREAGFDWGAQVPRLIASTVILTLVLAAIPVLRRHEASARRVVWPMVALVAVLVGSGSLLHQAAQAQKPLGSGSGTLPQRDARHASSDGTLHLVSDDGGTGIMGTPHENCRIAHALS